MTKKFLVLFFITTIIACNAWAAKVNESQARIIAGNFFNVTMPQKPN